MFWWLVSQDHRSDSVTRGALQMTCQTEHLPLLPSVPRNNANLYTFHADLRQYYSDVSL